MVSKKAQGLSINMIVVAGIALLVLVIIIAVFAGKMGDFTDNSDTCMAKGGTCQSDVCSFESKTVRVFASDCNDESSGNKYCCIALGSKTE